MYMAILTERNMEFDSSRYKWTMILQPPTNWEINAIRFLKLKTHTYKNITVILLTEDLTTCIYYLIHG